MDIQIKKLTTVINQLSHKLEQLQVIQNFEYKQISDLLLEINQVNAEICLLIQSVMNIDVSQLMDKTFNCLQNLLVHVLKSREQLNSKKIHQKSSSIQLVDTCVQNQVTQQSLLGGVHVSKQGNPSLKVKNITQVPWYDTSQVIHVPKKFVDKYTCTTEDYYLNCSKAISESGKRVLEFESILQFANESIALMGEALQNKILRDYKEKGKPEELEKLMNAIKFKKDDLEQIIKGVDLELLKDKVENYEFVESEIKNHIIQVQKETAERVFLYCKQLFKEQIKKGKYQLQDQLNRQNTFSKGDECRCSIYVGEIVSLQNKTEAQSQLINKQVGDLKEKDRVIQDLELQMKLLDGQLKQNLLEKQDLKQKIDSQQNIQRRGSILQRQSSFMKNIQQGDEQNQDQQQSSISPNRKMSREEKIPLNRNTKSQISLPFQQIVENLDDDQISIIIQKDKMLERLIVLTNALDKVNKDRRLSQLQYVVEQKGNRQLTDLLDLIKDIEENDLQFKDTKSFCHSQQDFDDSRSPINMPKHYHSQHIVDQGEAPPRQKFQSTRELNSPRVSHLEQIKEIDENKHILLIPIEQKVAQRKQSKNTSQSSFNDSNQQLDDASPESKQKHRVTRTQSNNNQKIFENKTEKVKRTSSIKLKINRKISNQNTSNDILSNPYGASTAQPMNSGSLTERLPLRQGTLQDDQFKFEKNIENDETQMKSSTNNHSLHDKPYHNQLQSGSTTQHHTPNNSSRLTKLKSINQNSDNISSKYASNQKSIAETSVQNAIQNLQQTKFQDMQSQPQETFQIQEENDKLTKKQSLATHNNNNNGVQLKQTSLQNTQVQQSSQRESTSINLNIINENKRSQRTNQYTNNPNFDDTNGESSNRSLRKMSRQNMSPNSNYKTVGNEPANVQSYKQSLLDRLTQQNDLKPQITNHKTQTSIENLESKKQDAFIKDYIKKQKEDFEKKQKEERVMFDQNLFDIAEQQEEQIIKYALNNTQGYMISQDINDSIVKQMYQNLKENGTQITQTINKFYQKQENQNIDFQDFQNFVSKFQNLHKRCGKDCIHVTRFYMRLGFIPIKYLNKRKAMRLAKPVVLPGFPKVA
ncbi:unnamed protein product [Paramecium octaurelia]|uniref:Uncharacterized protein n=1 Tax=Paramecium octaurelia TaxID=43137 RepID=A0A8S1WMG0_PAROT|nr:unnamed protein product [Paramecium octaurelia]